MGIAAYFFDVSDPWEVSVIGAPKFETYKQYFGKAVPQIARADLSPVKTPCVVVARVTSRVAQGRKAPAGPKDRAKGLMDALLDDRSNGPKYSVLGARAPTPADPSRLCRRVKRHDRRAGPPVPMVS